MPVRNVITDEIVHPLVCSVQEATKLLKCSRTRIYDLIDAGKLTPRKNGERTVFLYEDVQACARALPVGLSAPRTRSGGRRREGE